jgi:hypothetical protein
LDTLADFIPDRTHAPYRLTFWIGDVPFCAFDPWYERAGFSTSHGHQEITRVGELRRQQLRARCGEVDPDLVHG